MTVTAILGAAASVAGIALGLAPLLAALHCLQTRSSRDVSLAAVAVVFSGSCIWLAYGLALGSVPLIATNAAGALSGGICIRGRAPAGSSADHSAVRRAQAR